jgi:peptide/nickel transport system substrate-binding protein
MIALLLQNLKFLKLKKIASAFFAAFMIFGATACDLNGQGAAATTPGAAPESSPVSSKETADSAYKSEIVIVRPEDSNNLDPVTQDGNVNIWVLNLITEGLLQTTDDGASIETLLADSYAVSDDFLTYTFKIKPNLKFSNGDPVLAEDLVWSYERAMNAGDDSVWTEIVANLKSVEAPDDTTFIVNMKEPSPVSDATLTFFTLVIGDKSYFDEVGLDEYKKRPIGTGAYKLDEWRTGEFLRVVKNENFRDADKVVTESIRFNVVPDDNTRVMQLQSGEADIATYVSFARLDELANDPNLKVVKKESTEMRMLALNCDNGPTANVDVRKAIAMAIDREAIVKMVLFNHGTLADSYLAQAVPYYSKPKTYSYDVEAAKELLAGAGYPDGFDITLTTVSGNANYENMANLVKEQLSLIGINVEIELLEAGTHNSKRNELKLGLFFGGWTSDIPDPSQQTGYYCQPVMANCVHTGWQNEEVIALAETAALEMDETKRAEMYKQIQQIYADEVPSIPIYYAPFANAMSKNVEGFEQTPLGNYRLNAVSYKTN